MVRTMLGRLDMVRTLLGRLDNEGGRFSDGFKLVDAASGNDHRRSEDDYAAMWGDFCYHKFAADIEGHLESLGWKGAGGPHLHCWMPKTGRNDINGVVVVTQ